MKILVSILILTILNGCSFFKTNKVDLRKPSSSSEGGRIAGNGGNVLICGENIDVLDLAIRTKKNYIEKPDEERMNIIIENLKDSGGLIGLELEEFYKEYKTRYEKSSQNYYKWSEREFELEKINDSELSKTGFKIPQNCEIKQTIRRHSTNKFEDGVEFLVHSSIFEKIKSNNQLTWLLIHEFLWNKLKTAKEIRDVNEFLHSEEFIMNKKIATAFLAQYNLINTKKIKKVFNRQYAVGEDDKFFAVLPNVEYYYVGAKKVLLKRSDVNYKEYEFFIDNGYKIPDEYFISEDKEFQFDDIWSDKTECLILESAKGNAFYYFDDKYLFRKVNKNPGEFVCKKNIIFGQDGNGKRIIEFDGTKSIKHVDKNYKPDTTYSYKNRVIRKKNANAVDLYKVFTLVRNDNGAEFYLNEETGLFEEPKLQISENNQFSIVSFDNSKKDMKFICQKGYSYCEEYIKTEDAEYFWFVPGTNLVKLNFNKILAEDRHTPVNGNGFVYVGEDRKVCRLATRIYSPMLLGSTQGWTKYKTNKYYNSISKLDAPKKCYFDDRKHYICEFSTENSNTVMPFDFTECESKSEQKLDVLSYWVKIPA